jgi:hypothetical protein
MVAGEQIRHRVRPTGRWSPGPLMLHVRVGEGLTKRRETRSVTAVPDVTPTASPFSLRLFLHGWGLT